MVDEDGGGHGLAGAAAARRRASSDSLSIVSMDGIEQALESRSRVSPCTHPLDVHRLREGPEKDAQDTRDLALK